MQYFCEKGQRKILIAENLRHKENILEKFF